MTTQLPIDYENTQIGTGVRWFGNVADLKPTKVKLFADGSDEYKYRDSEHGLVIVRTWADGRKRIKTHQELLP